MQSAENSTVPLFLLKQSRPVPVSIKTPIFKEQLVTAVVHVLPASPL